MLKLSKYKPYYEKAAGILLILLFSIGLSSFISINHITHTDTQNHDSLKFEYSEPLYFDFEEILKRGTIRTNSQYVPEGYSSSGSEIVILEEDNYTWTMRINAPELKQKADEFILKHLRYRETDSQFLRSAYPNLFRRHNLEDDNLMNRFRSSNYDIIYAGYLSPYDEMIKDIAEEAEVDWKLVVAVMAQESSFNPDAESVAGALGLMQIIPRFSLIESEELLYDPETNIREGVRYLKKHLENNAHLDSLNRYSMALATYNVGSGNISDAKRLAVQLGNNPDEWIYIAEALLKLMQPEYYEDARYGYKRGTETVNYVKAVLNRYSEYHTVNQWAGHLED